MMLDDEVDEAGREFVRSARALLERTRDPSLDVGLLRFLRHYLARQREEIADELTVATARNRVREQVLEILDAAVGEVDRRLGAPKGPIQ